MNPTGKPRASHLALNRAKNRLNRKKPGMSEEARQLKRIADSLEFICYMIEEEQANRR